MHKQETMQTILQLKSCVVHCAALMHYINRHRCVLINVSSANRISFDQK